jgi:hypothetical protein
MLRSVIFLIAVALSASAFARGGGHGGGGRSGGGHTAGNHVSRGSGGSHSVRGYVTKRGTYVKPHRATNPDSTKANNWSHKGNVNPYTGKEGTKKD